jgi:hypothetical protein
MKHWLTGDMIKINSQFLFKKPLTYEFSPGMLDISVIPHCHKWPGAETSPQF